MEAADSPSPAAARAVARIYRSMRYSQGVGRYGLPSPEILEDLHKLFRLLGVPLAWLTEDGEVPPDDE